MARDVLQVVDSIGATPTVIVDLNARSPYFITKNGWSAPAPQLSRSMSRSNATDGDNISQSSYMDRVIEARIGVLGATDDATALAIQAVARVTNKDGYWLKWQPRTATKPVFFRCKRSDITEFVEYNGNTPIKVMGLRIPAEPFAYGLPVSDTVSISNNPAAAVNPMSFLFPTVEGDVSSPLSLKVLGQISNAADGLSSGTLIASTAADDAPTSTPYVDSASITPAATVSGYTVSTIVSPAVGGTVLRYVCTGGGEQVVSSNIATGVPPGDYRVLVRASSTTADVKVTLGNPSGSTAVVSRTVQGMLGNGWQDFGVMRLPFDSSLNAASDGFGPTTPYAPLRMSITAPVATTFFFDAIMFVPAGLDTARETRLMIIKRTVLTGAINLYVNAASGEVYATNTSTPPQYLTNVRSVGGGAPKVTPGTRNLLTFVRNTGPGTVDDFVTRITDVVWSYYPRYLYIRPATS